MLPLPNEWINSHQETIYYQGPPLEEGPKPAIIYFALSGQSSLGMEPFNQPVPIWHAAGIRTFSWDLPFHTLQDDPKKGLYQWARAFQKDPYFLDHFIKKCRVFIDELIDQQWILPHQIAVTGLSRGAFVASHLAAQDSRLSCLLGFAPLTTPRPAEEFDFVISPSVSQWDLIQVVPHLISKNVRFYIGNHDTRVGTDNCYQFIRHLTQTALAQGMRSSLAELTIYSSVGYKGHGTPSSIFKEGAQWLAQILHGDQK